METANVSGISGVNSSGSIDNYKEFNREVNTVENQNQSQKIQDQVKDESRGKQVDLTA